MTDEKEEFNLQKTCKMLCGGLVNFFTFTIYFTTTITLTTLFVLMVNCYKYLGYATEAGLEDSKTFIMIILVSMIAFQILSMLMLILCKVGNGKDDSRKQ